MTFASSAEARAVVLTACRVLTHFRLAEGFGHVSARVAGSNRILITPRRALALVSEPEPLRAWEYYAAIADGRVAAAPAP